MSEKRLYATITVQAETSEEDDIYLEQQLKMLVKDLDTYLSNRSMSFRMVEGKVTEVKRDEG